MASAIILLGILAIFPLPASANTAEWSAGTARVLPPGRVECGLFQPLQVGLSRRVELSVQPLLAAVMPNLSGKVFWLDINGVMLSSIHRFFSPTPLLRLLSQPGTGGILPADNIIPFLLQWDNAILVSYQMAPEHLVTAKVGAAVAFSRGEKRMNTIDYHLAYARTAALHEGYLITVGLDFDGRISGRFDYILDLDLFLMPSLPGRYAVEHSGLVVWRKSKTFSAYLGYKISVAELPYGVDWQIFPLIDLQWAYHK